MAKRYELNKATNLQYYFTLHADNNEKILTSETYGTKQAAQNGIASVRANSPFDARYDRRTSQRGLPYFVLRAANSEVIGTGEEYSSPQGRENGIAAVKAVAPTAPVVDKT